MTTPTPSDAAMAAAEEIRDYIGNGYVPETAKSEREHLGAIIDRHFAPLREELEKDKVRLDWLDHAKSAEYSEGHCGWAINYVVTGDTLRAAIDAAMTPPNTLPHA